VITREAYADYTINIVKLKLWYLNWLYNFGVDFDFSISKHINLYFHTSLCKYSSETDSATRRKMVSEDKVWQQILQRLKEKISAEKRRSAFMDLTPFENDCLALMQPYIDEHIDEHVLRQEEPADSPFGCFSYNLTAGSDEFINIHFSNIYAPDSPFIYHEELKKTLLALVLDAKEKHPARKYIQIYSWIACLPKFAELFPTELKANAIAVGPDAGDGCWGQFVDRRGGFNYRRGDILRKTGQFAFVYSRSWCSFESLIKYLF
jgi:hypothetical protein